MCVEKHSGQFDSTRHNYPRIVIQRPSITASDYLVPLSLTEHDRRHQLLQVHSLKADNPLYISEEYVTYWLQQQQQERSEVFECSYHDYEDIFTESVNMGVVNPMLMKRNEAYSVCSTLPRSILNQSIEA